MPTIIEKNNCFPHLIQSITSYLDATTLYVTSITMTVIAFDRYYMIVMPLNQNPFDTISSKLLLIIIWFSSLLLSIPFFVTRDIHSVNYRNLSLDCYQKKELIETPLMSEITFIKITRLFRFFIHYAIPLLVTTFLYARILYDLIFRRNSQINSTNFKFESKILKTTKILISVLIVFTFSYFGCYFIMIGQIFSTTQSFVNFCQINKKLYLTCHGIPFLSCILNPFIYWWMSPTFRNDYKRLFRIS